MQLCSGGQGKIDRKATVDLDYSSGWQAWGCKEGGGRGARTNHSCQYLSFAKGMQSSA